MRVYNKTAYVHERAAATCRFLVVVPADPQPIYQDVATADIMVSDEVLMKELESLMTSHGK